MEDFSFDIGGILSEEEANKLFDEQPSQEKPREKEEPEEEEKQTETPAEEEEETQPSERVGEEENKSEEDTVGQQDDGSSPNLLSSIAIALKKDGIFSDLSDEDISAVQSPEDFAELFEKAVSNRLDERQRRIDEALQNGVDKDTVRMYEQTIQYLDSIDGDALSAEGEEGEALRAQMIYNDLMNRGFSKEKAQKEVDKSFKSGSDVDDAKDALDALKVFYKNGYDKVRDDAKKKTEEAKATQKKQTEDFRKMVLEDELMFGEAKIDKRIRQKIYDAVMSPVEKDEESGKYLTLVQKFQKEHPLEFLKQIGMWFVLTDAGKNPSGVANGQVKKAKKEGIRELEKKLRASSLNPDGSLRFVSGGQTETDDILLSDDWRVGYQ